MFFIRVRRGGILLCRFGVRLVWDIFDELWDKGMVRMVIL